MKNAKGIQSCVLLWLSGIYRFNFKRGIMACFLILIVLTNVYSQDIHRAAYEGNVEKVESMLKENPLLVNAEDKSGRTPIFMAVIAGNQDMVELLIKNGAQVRVGDSNLRAPIHYAGFMNNINMIKLLLDNGSVIDTRAIGAATPLIHSSLSDRSELSRFLIEQGADINIQCNSLTTPLYFAALNNNLGYLNFLLDNGADLDTPDFLNRTPLYVAVRDGYLEIVKSLIEHGADFLIKDSYLNRNLLHLAATHGYVEIAEVLINRGLDINGKDEKGYTSLDYAHRYGQKSMTEFLGKNGGEPGLSKTLILAKSITAQDIQNSEAAIIKLQNGSWGIRTQKHFLIFAYSEIGTPSPDRSMVNGYLTGEELKNLSWIYFDLSFHPGKADFSLQGQTPIYSLQDRLNNLAFILNDAFQRNYARLNLKNSYFPKAEHPFEAGGIKVAAVPSYQNKKGYFIECDGLCMFWLSGLSDDYICSKRDSRVVEFVRSNFSEIDLLFLGTPDGIGPEKGNGIRETYLESRGLNPKAVFFMGKEPMERRILYQIKRRIQNPGNIYCSENPGDIFIYSKGEIR